MLLGVLMVPIGHFEKYSNWRCISVSEKTFVDRCGDVFRRAFICWGCENVGFAHRADDICNAWIERVDYHYQMKLNL